MHYLKMTQKNNWIVQAWNAPTLLFIEAAQTFFRFLHEFTKKEINVYKWIPESAYTFFAVIHKTDCFNGPLRHFVCTRSNHFFWILFKMHRNIIQHWPMWTSVIFSLLSKNRIPYVRMWTKCPKSHGCSWKQSMKTDLPNL